MKEHTFLFSMLLNQLFTLLVFFNWLLSIFFSISWLICSIIITLLIYSCSIFLGLIKRDDGLLKKLSLWSFKVILYDLVMFLASILIVFSNLSIAFWYFLVMFSIINFSWSCGFQGSTATTRQGVTRNRNRKRLRHTGNLYIKTYS